MHMRTTLSQARSYAESRDISLGNAVSELVRKGLHAPLKTRVVNGFHAVELPPESPVVSVDHVRVRI